MKRIVLVFLTISFLAANTLYSKPEKVYSIIKIIKPIEWYAIQSQEWKSVIDSNPENAEAWLNFYTANRMAKMLNAEEYANGLGKYFFQLESIVKTANQKISDTFEAKYIEIWNMENYFYEKELLEETHAQYPNRYELYDKMIVLYELERDKQKRAEFNKMLYENDPTVSTGLLTYNYNVLMSLEDNALIITNGDNDTFPIWMLQDVFGIRNDVYALNISLLSIDRYRNKIFEEIGVAQFKINWQEIAKTNDQFAVFNKIIGHMAHHNDKQPLYIASSVFERYYDTIKDSIYLTGLALKYSKEEFDNIAYMKRNFEKQYRLDMLNNSIIKDFSRSVTSILNLNYLPMLLKLQKHYQILNDTNSLELIRDIVLSIAKNSDREMEILNTFNITK